jgi:hypothetical protein
MDREEDEESIGRTNRASLKTQIPSNFEGIVVEMN